MCIIRLICKGKDEQLSLCLLWSVKKLIDSVCLLDTLEHRQLTE